MSKVSDLIKRKVDALENLPITNEETKKPPLPPIESKPVSEEIKEPIVPKPINYLDVLKENIENKNAASALDSLIKGKLGENSLLSILYAFDSNELRAVRNEKLDFTYIRRIIYKLIKYFTENKNIITPTIIGLVKKSQEILIPTMDNYQEYQIVWGYLGKFLKWVETIR